MVELLADSLELWKEQLLVFWMVGWMVVLLVMKMVVCLVASRETHSVDLLEFLLAARLVDNLE